MHPLRGLGNERGIALITVLLVSMVIAGIAVGAALVSTNVALINRYHDRQSLLASAADAGLEQARSLVNGNKSLYPASGYATLENGALVTDASGTVIPGLKRYLYVGPTGVTSGQYGVFGSIVSIVKDAQGDQVVRRQEVVQESFAKFAYFTDVEPSTIAFGNGDAIYGPVHTNDTLRIYSSGATFYGPVETSKAINGKPYGTFKQGYTENAVAVPMPTTVDLAKLKTQAQAGNLALTSGTLGKTQATLRIEFIAIDLNADGNVTDANEGFVRVYQAINSSDVVWTTGDRPNNVGGLGLAASENCGDYTNHAGKFVAAKNHPKDGHDYLAALTSASRRCYLGGSDSLFGSFQNEQATDAHGAWQKWPGPAVNNPVVQARADGAYLWPISRAFNPTFKAVIYVDGDVVVSGVVRGQVTLAASGNIIIGDDITYATNPAAGTCNDILGLFAGLNVVIADNTVNSPSIPDKGGTTYYTYDDTKDEFIQGVVLALNQFTVENYTTGSTNAESCETTARGRGCIYLTGGIIQRQRGAVGLTDGHGYLKRYSYDACAFSNPPPYFPTTGRFARGRYYEVDPTGFTVSGYYELLTP